MEKREGYLNIPIPELKPTLNWKTVPIRENGEPLVLLNNILHNQLLPILNILNKISPTLLVLCMPERMLQKDLSWHPIFYQGGINLYFGHVETSGSATIII